MGQHVGKTMKKAVRLFETGRLDQAERQCQRILARHPGHIPALGLLGRIHQTQRRFDEAEAAYLKVLEALPDDHETRIHLIHCYRDGGNIEGMLELAEYFENDENHPESRLIAFRSYLHACDWERAGRLQKDVLAQLEANAVPLPYLAGSLLDLNALPGLEPERIFRIHKLWGDQIMQEAQRRRLPLRPPIEPRDRIRIGYLSADFNMHPVGNLIHPVLAHHDRSRFEVFCYAHLRKDDEMTARIRDCADHFVDVTAMAHDEIALRINRDGIHILVELGGHTDASQLPALAFRPAPVQISYLGYPNTTGLATVDYRITDVHADPEHVRTPYVEQLLRLPESFLTMFGLPDLPRTEHAPAEANGFVTFGSFNNIRKLNPEVIRVWSRILTEAPDSRLIIKSAGCESSMVRQNITRTFERHGVDASRIEFAAYAHSYAEHAAWYNRVDIMLDPFPYHGTHTTCESLWMGVPVVTLEGDTHVQRVSAAIMRNIGYDVTIAASEDEYVENAVNLASIPENLPIVRKCLHTLFRHSIICHPERVTRHLEDAYARAWAEKTGKSGESRTQPAPSDTDADIQWIFVVGMLRSGSTWAYNVARLLLEHAGRGTAIGFVGEGDAVEQALLKQEGKAPRLIKFHLPLPKAEALLESGAARAIHTQRDLRDVAVSLMNFESQDFDTVLQRLPEIIQTHARWKRQPNIISIEYADIRQSPKEVVRTLADFLGIAVDDDAIERIVHACSLQSVQRQLQAMDTSKADNVTAIDQDRKFHNQTLLHGNHITSGGQTGAYRDMLNESQIERLNAVLHDWLVAEGYEEDALFDYEASDGIMTVPIEDGVRICVPDDVRLMTPYVLLEQGDWFEDEIRFVRRLIRPGMRVLDIGANYGCYAMSIAKRLDGKGRLWAFEPASSTAGFLERSIQANRFGNVFLVRAALSSQAGTARLSLDANSELNALSHGTNQGPSEEVKLTRLDDCIEQYGWNGMDFVKMDAEGEEVRILEGGCDFFTRFSPLVMFELKHGNEVNHGLIEAFQRLGYQTWALVPGLQVLAPFNPHEPHDEYLLNLFACKEDAARRLAAEGLLALDTPETVKPFADWQISLPRLPYGKALMEIWQESVREHPQPGWKAYEQSLNHYLSALEADSAGQALAHLQLAFSGMVSLFDVHMSTARLMTLARIAANLGYRSVAVHALNQVAVGFEQNPVFRPLEPFLTVSCTAEQVDMENRMADWALAQTLAERERLRAYSSYFTGEESLPSLELLEQLGFMDNHMRRRLKMIRMRHGATPVGRSEALAQA